MVDRKGREKRSRGSRVVGAALAAVVVIGYVLAVVPVASADIVNSQSRSAQEGDNDNDTEQDGEGRSGDAVVGQVAGVVSSGDASVDATNLSRDVDAESGNAEGANTARTFTGTTNIDSGCPRGAGRAQAQACPKRADASDISNLIAILLQLGDNSVALDQTARVVSGDAIAGQVVGAVVAGLADIVLANTSEDVDATSGDGEITNLADVAVTSTSVTLTERCSGGCPLPTDRRAAAGAETDVDSGGIGPLAGFRAEGLRSLGGLGTSGSGVAMAGLFLVAAILMARRRRVTAPAQAPSTVRAEPTPAMPTGGSRTTMSAVNVLSAGAIVVGSFLLVHRFGRR